MKRTSGFTLIEMMVATSAALVIALVITQMVKMNQQSWEVSDAYLSSSLELRRAAEAIGRELVAAKNSTLSIPADGTWYNTVSFQVPKDMDGNGVVVYADGTLELSDPIVYSLGGGGHSGDQVIRSQANHGDRVIADGVSALQFRRNVANPELVEISMTVQRGMGDFKNQGSLATKIRVRN